MREWVYCLGAALAVCCFISTDVEAARPTPFLAPYMDCLGTWTPKPVLRDVGVETIHREEGESITIFLPLPKTSSGRILDINAMPFGEKFPDRFTLTDGSLSAAFVSVDQRPGSHLDSCVNEMLVDVKSRMRDRGEDALTVLTDFLDDYMAPVPNDFHFPWELRTPALPPEFGHADSLPVGHYPLRTELQLPSVPLESFLLNGHGVCMHRVMLTSLMLNKLGITHKLRAGASAHSGHIWIELPDGRHLDPTWHLLMKPSFDGMKPGWFQIDRTKLFYDQVYPFIVDKE